jgi:hypothetical protein
LDTKLADLGIAKALRQLCSDESAKYLLYVEDDLRRPGDPAISNGQAGLIFLRDQVVHWCELAKDNVSEVGTFLRKGSSGFPLNAFVAQFPMRYLRHEGLSESELLATITDSVVAVVVAAYDAESFLIWHPVGIQP